MNFKNEQLLDRLIHGKLAYLPHNLITALISLLFCFVSMVLVQKITEVFFSRVLSLGNFNSIFQYCCIIVLSILLVSLMLRRFNKKDLGFEITNIKLILLYSISFAVLFNVVILIAEKLDPTLAQSSDVVLKSLGIGKTLSGDIVAILTVVVFAPLWEEVVYRGLAFRGIRDGLYSKFKNYIPTIVGILVSSLLFMDAHGGEGQEAQLLYLFLLGFMMAISYLYTGSLLTPILFHSLNNTYVIFSSLIKSNLNLVGNISPYIVFLGPVITVIIFLMISKIYQIAKLKV